MKKVQNLSRPRTIQPLSVRYSHESFGRLSEAVARKLGTAQFLITQTVLVLLWVILNVASIALRWDPYPFILLNLMFSIQAAYAGPLILLAQNRQEQRDRSQAEYDRIVASNTQANAEFLARELASVRLSLSNVVTVDELRDQLDDIVRRLNESK